MPRVHAQKQTMDEKKPLKSTPKEEPHKKPKDTIYEFNMGAYRASQNLGLVLSLLFIGIGLLVNYLKK